MKRINIKHKSGSYILMKADGTIEINGDTKLIGKLDVTGEVTAIVGDDSVGLSTHTHVEVPGTGGASSPSPATAETASPTKGT